MPNYTMQFWNGLAAATGDNQLHIMLRDGFGIKSEDRKLLSKLPQGEMYCAAEAGGGGNTLRLDVVEAETENAVKVYWLPWRDGETTLADRVDFENSDCSFFMTPRLEGCRFVLTEHQVLHVASNANHAAEGSAGSRTRDYATEQVIGDARSRRLSISTTNINDDWAGYPYEKQAFVFGVKIEDAWKYKALMYLNPQVAGPPFGQWTTFSNP